MCSQLSLKQKRNTSNQGPAWKHFALEKSLYNAVPQIMNMHQHTFVDHFSKATKLRTHCYALYLRFIEESYRNKEQLRLDIASLQMYWRSICNWGYWLTKNLFRKAKCSVFLLCCFCSCVSGSCVCMKTWSMSCCGESTKQPRHMFVIVNARVMARQDETIILLSWKVMGFLSCLEVAPT